MNPVLLAIVLIGPTSASAAELTCKDLALLRVILRQDMVVDACAAKVEGDALSRESASPLELVSNDPNKAHMDELRVIVADLGLDDHVRLNAARVLAYFGDRRGVDVLSRAADGNLAKSASGVERSKAALCLLYLECELPDHFAFSGLPTPLYPELDALLETSSPPVDPNIPTNDEIEAIVGAYVGLGRSVEVTGPLSVAEVEQEALMDILCGIVQRNDMRSIPRLPFGYINEAWQDFKKGIRAGDLIYYFTSDEQSWRALFGIEGYALIRDGRVVDILVTAIS